MVKTVTFAVKLVMELLVDHHILIGFVSIAKETDLGCICKKVGNKQILIHESL